MKTSLLIVLGLFSIQTVSASTCENRMRFRGPNVAFGITFWKSAPQGNTTIEQCMNTAFANLGSKIDCDSEQDYPMGCEVYASDYKFTADNGQIYTGTVRQ